MPLTGCKLPLKQLPTHMDLLLCQRSVIGTSLYYHCQEVGCKFARIICDWGEFCGRPIWNRFLSKKSSLWNTSSGQLHPICQSFDVAAKHAQKEDFLLDWAVHWCHWDELIGPLPHPFMLVDSILVQFCSLELWEYLESWASLKLAMRAYLCGKSFSQIRNSGFFGSFRHLHPLTLGNWHLYWDPSLTSLIPSSTTSLIDPSLDEFQIALLSPQHI